MLPLALALLTLGEGELRWQAPQDQCPSAETVQAQIDAAGGLGELQVDAVVSADPSSGWMLELTIVLGDASDTRILRDADCVALAEAAVLLVATRLDLEAMEEPAEPLPPGDSVPPVETPPQDPAPAPPGEPTQPNPVPTRAKPSPPEPAEAPDVALSTGLTFAAAAGISLGSVPNVGVPSELAVGHAWPNVRVGLRGRVHVGAAERLAETGSIRIVVGSAGPRVCARPHWRRLEFPVCGEFGVGGSRAVTRGPARDRGGVWVEAGVGAGLAWFVDPRWALTAHLAGVAPLLGTGYTLGATSLWDPAPVAGRVMLGVEFFVPIQIGGRPEKSQ